MEKFEQPASKESIPPEESGVRPIPTGLTDEELHLRLDAKKREVHPEDPWEEFGPKDEPNTAKVWGMEDLSKEERQERAARIAETQRLLDQLKQEERDEGQKKVS